ncbi:MAG: SAM-dependent methyltransferase [Parasphingorhabdus sp.]
MKPGQASQTAQFAAILRAHHYLSAKGQKLLEDSLALPLSGLQSKEAVKQAVTGLREGYSALGGSEVAAAFVEQIEHAVCIRSRLVEERLRQTKDAGLQQLVVLGAGMDTTAYRCQDLVADIDVIEIDHPDTQALKREKLNSSGIAIPANLHFVGFDFENQTLEEALEMGGVDQAKQSLFPWLGVNMYLTEEAVNATLAVVAQFPPGSELIADFMPEYETSLSDQITSSVDELAQQVAEMGEPIESRFTESSLHSRLKEAGFDRVDFYSGKKIVDELLGGDRDAYCMPDDAVSLFCAVI